MLSMFPPARNDLPRWLSSASIAWIGATLALLVLGLGAGLVLYEQRKLHDRELQSAELYARVLQDHVERTFDTIDIALSALSDRLSDGAKTEDPARLGDELGHAQQGMPFLRSLSVIDASGRVLGSSVSENVGVSVDLARIELPTRGHADRLGRVVSGRDLADASIDHVPSAARTFVPLVRAAGTMRGTPVFLVATLNTAFFANGFDLTLADQTRAAGLFFADAVLLAGTEGLRTAPGESAVGRQFFHDYLPSRERGSLIGAGIDGTQVVSAFRMLRKRPLVVIVERDYRYLSAETSRTAVRVAAVGGATLLVMAVLVVLAWRSLRGHEAVRFALDLAHQKNESQLAFTARLLEVSPTPLFVKDVDGRFISVNRAWLDLMGLEAHDVEGRRSSDLFGDEATLHSEHDQRLLESERRISYENRLSRPGRGARDTIVTKVRFTHADGTPAGIVGSIIDVTEFRDAERRTREARDEAEFANSAKSEFIANISHELRTPLQAILGFADLGADLSSDLPEFLEMFQDIQAGGQRMLTLVNGLLDVSLMDGSAQSLAMHRCDVSALIREAVDQMEPKAALRGQCLQWRGPIEGVAADVDAARFQQAVRNVLANAIRFSPVGGLIEVSCKDLGEAGVELTIRDHGPGIPETELESIFDAFVQSTRTRDGAGGTGLGLTISRKIMRALGGSIQASNAASGGALMRLCLPACSHAPSPPVPCPTGELV